MTDPLGGSEWRHRVRTDPAIESHLDRTRGERRTLQAAGAGASGRAEVAERIEDILAAEWAGGSASH